MPQGIFNAVLNLKMDYRNGTILYSDALYALKECFEFQAGSRSSSLNHKVINDIKDRVQMYLQSLSPPNSCLSGIDPTELKL